MAKFHGLILTLKFPNYNNNPKFSERSCKPICFPFDLYLSCVIYQIPFVNKHVVHTNTKNGNYTKIIKKLKKK